MVYEMRDRVREKLLVDSLDKDLSKAILLGLSSQ